MGSPPTKPAILVAPTPNRRLRCLACAHGCELDDGERGICGVRVRSGSTLLAPFGYVARASIQPIETHAFYHLRPGALALTFGTHGCDLVAERDGASRPGKSVRERRRSERPASVSAEALIARAVAAGCGVVCAAYTEPMVAAEWVHEVFSAAKRSGLVTAMVTHGHTTPEALDYMRRVTDALRVEIRATDAAGYRALGGRAEAVWAALSRAHRLGYWIEAAIPAISDGEDGEKALQSIASRLARVSRDIPLHTRGASGSLLGLAPTLGQGKLRYLYRNGAGVAERANTRCPGCRTVVIERARYEVRANRLVGGRCQACNAVVPGRFD